MAGTSARTAALAALALALSGCPVDEDRSPICRPDQTFCAGLCRDPATFQTDPEHCGACGIACGVGTCAGGVCQCEGATLCPDQNPRCVDIQNDPENCSGCGVACPKPGAGCAGGVCGCYPPRPDECETLCTNWLTDPTNCGACGNVCPLTNDVCVGGSCQCPTSLPDPCPPGAPTTCVNLGNDERNCGACGTICPTGASCVARSCTCPAALPDVCNQACVSKESDEQNCGACGVVCPATATCSSGDCVCPAGPQPGCGGVCCGGGTACCDPGCPPAHSNGLGQTFFHCNPVGTRTLDSATAAARAWRSTGAVTGQALGCIECLGWETQSACAVWCFGSGILGDRVHENTITPVCLCPSTLDPTWN